ncbi:M20/M25/M40 family metallo-hydrolase [Pseudoduganella sp. UC29_106]|uniref:M20/M25/M40 family metallo-hydrolase n=1 Tax=Pseudoduganella sp. UC29_106 TaxID=3374553 RepID=UPI003756AD9B
MPCLLAAIGVATSLAAAPALLLAADKAEQRALSAITEPGLMGTIRILASDEYEGRSPGTEGETKTIAYLEREFRKLGLKPGNPNGSYLQAVPLRSQTATPRFSYTVAGKTVDLKFPDDFVAHSTGPATDVNIKDSELVFVGYGVQAPEYGWDDYKGLDVKGKTIVMLINDPAVPDPKDPSQLDPSLFKGKEMTYYGRWTYKYEIAAKLGAAAAIIVHETKPAAYPYGVVRSGGIGEQFSLEGDSRDNPEVPGWIHEDRARELVAAAGYDFDALKKAALSKDFKPVSLKGVANFEIRSQRRMLDSHNVAALLPGSDPKLKNEFIIYSAHWDHLGIDEKLPGSRTQQIYHGALDNASGTAALLELAKAFKALPKPPKRSILFLATTAEERGLLGAKYYAHHPLYPIDKTLANINIDGVNAWGRTAQIENVTSGHSTLDDLLERRATQQGRRMVPNSRPELGNFYRADQLEFARVGVPVLYTKARSNYLGKPESYAREVVDRYTEHDYHKVTDDVRGDWDFSGGIQDIRLLFQVGLDVANGVARPVWKPASEFSKLRD